MGNGLGYKPHKTQTVSTNTPAKNAAPLPLITKHNSAFSLQQPNTYNNEQQILYNNINLFNGLVILITTREQRTTYAMMRYYAFLHNESVYFYVVNNRYLASSYNSDTNSLAFIGANQYIQEGWLTKNHMLTFLPSPENFVTMYFYLQNNNIPLTKTILNTPILSTQKEVQYKQKDHTHPYVINIISGVFLSDAKPVYFFFGLPQRNKNILYTAHKHTLSIENDLYEKIEAKINYKTTPQATLTYTSKENPQTTCNNKTNTSLPNPPNNDFDWNTNGNYQHPDDPQNPSYLDSLSLLRNIPYIAAAAIFIYSQFAAQQPYSQTGPSSPTILAILSTLNIILNRRTDQADTRPTPSAEHANSRVGSHTPDTFASLAELGSSMEMSTLMLTTERLINRSNNIIFLYLHLTTATLRATRDNFISHVQNLEDGQTLLVPVLYDGHYTLIAIENSNGINRGVLLDSNATRANVINNHPLYSSFNQMVDEPTIIAAQMQAPNDCGFHVLFMMHIIITYGLESAITNFQTLAVSPQITQTDFFSYALRNHYAAVAFPENTEKAPTIFSLMPPPRSLHDSLNLQSHSNTQNPNPPSQPYTILSIPPVIFTIDTPRVEPEHSITPNDGNCSPKITKIKLQIEQQEFIDTTEDSNRQNRAYQLSIATLNVINREILSQIVIESQLKNSILDAIAKNNELAHHKQEYGEDSLIEQLNQIELNLATLIIDKECITQAIRKTTRKIESLKKSSDK